MNKIIRTFVGADLSRPAPIYRPPVDVPVSEVFCEKSLSRPQGQGFTRQFDQHPTAWDAINRVPTDSPLYGSA